MKSIEVTAEDLLSLISGDVAHIIVGEPRRLLFAQSDLVRIVLHKNRTTRADVAAARITRTTLIAARTELYGTDIDALKLLPSQPIHPPEEPDTPEQDGPSNESSALPESASGDRCACGGNWPCSTKDLSHMRVRHANEARYDKLVKAAVAAISIEQEPDIVKLLEAGLDAARGFE